MTKFGFDKIEYTAKQVLTELNLPEETRTRCFAILDDTRTKDRLTKRNTDGVIAGSIYIASILTENRLTQHRIADVMDISEATIRKYYTMLVKVLNLKKKKDH